MILADLLSYKNLKFAFHNHVSSMPFRYGSNGTVLAGYHYDLNFLTIHGKSRFPGLFVWLADGRRMPVKVPPGHLIVQVGLGLRRFTFHVRNDQTCDFLQSLGTFNRATFLQSPILCGFKDTNRSRLEI